MLRDRDQATRYFCFATSRFANNDRIWINRGDEEGVLSRDSGGKPVPAGTPWSNPMHTLSRDGELWRSEENTGSGSRFQDGRPNNLVVDPRTFGLRAAMTHATLAEALKPNPGAPKRWRYSESTEGDIHVVTGECEDGRVTQWWIDSQRGWNPIRVRTQKGDRWWESRTTLRQFDGVWFPETVEYRDSRWKDGANPQWTIRVYDAEFNKPEHPDHFTPQDIGIESGMGLALLDTNFQPREWGFFDGKQFVPVTDYYEKRVADARAASETPPPMDLEQVRTRVEAVRRYESVWEAYTREFIEKYALGEDQTQKAWQILRDCQDNAKNYLTKRLSYIQKLERELAGLKDLDEKERAPRAAALADVLDKLCKPIDTIFERQLKPRLAKLPTRKQRAAVEKAEGQAGEQPAKKRGVTSRP